MRRCDKSHAENKNEEEMVTGADRMGSSRKAPQSYPSLINSECDTFRETLKGREMHGRRMDSV